MTETFIDLSSITNKITEPIHKIEDKITGGFNDIKNQAKKISESVEKVATQVKQGTDFIPKAFNYTKGFPKKIETWFEHIIDNLLKYGKIAIYLILIFATLFILSKVATIYAAASKLLKTPK